MLEQWLADISALTRAGDSDLPGGLRSRDILYAWDVMHPIVRSTVECRLRNESTGSIRAALIRIPVLINQERRAPKATKLPHVRNQERRALKATKLPHVRVLQRRLDALFRQCGLGFGALARDESPSQQFVRLAQEAFGVQDPASISRHHIQDERRREKDRARRMPTSDSAQREAFDFAQK